jgi:hypothetical protein
MDGAAEKVRTTGQKIADFGDSMTKFVSGPLAAAGAGFTAAAKKAGEYAEQVELAAAQSGMSAENVQEIAFAAQRVSGVKFDSTRDGLKELALRSAEAAEGTGEAQEAFDRLGISQRELQSMSTGELFTRVREEMKGLTKQQRILTAEQVFGGEAGEKFAEVMGLSAEQMREFRDAAEESGNVLSEEQVQAADRAKESYNALKQDVNGLVLQLGAGLAPVFTNTVIPLMRGATDAVQSVVEGFNSLSTTTKTLIGAAGGFVAAIGPVASIFGRVLPLVTQIGPALGRLKTLASGLGAAFSAMTGPIGLTVGILAALGVLAYEVWDNWEDFAGNFRGLWEGLVQVSEASFSIIVDSFKVLFFKIVREVKEGLNSILGVYNSVAEKFGGETIRLFDASSQDDRINNLEKNINESWDRVQAGADQTWSNIGEGAGKMVENIKEDISELGQAFSNALPSAGGSGGESSGGNGSGGSSGSGSSGGGATVTGGGGGLSSAGLATGNPLQGTIGQMPRKFTKLNWWDKLKGKIIKLGQSATSQFGTLTRAVYRFGSGVGRAFSDAIMEGKNLKDTMMDVLKSLVKQLISTIAKAAALAAILSIINPGVGFGGAFSTLIGGGGISSVTGGGLTKRRAVGPSSPAARAGSTARTAGAGGATSAKRKNSNINVNIQPSVLPNGDLAFASRKAADNRERLGYT